MHSRAYVPQPHRPSTLVAHIEHASALDQPAAYPSSLSRVTGCTQRLTRKTRREPFEDATGFRRNEVS